MKKQLITTAVLLAVSSISFADVGWARAEKPRHLIKVAVIDTGIDAELLKGNSYCPTGHKDFTNSPWGIIDNHGHGTHISGLIDQYAKNYIFKLGAHPDKIDDIKVNYCQIILKYFDPRVPTTDNLKNTIAAFRWAIDHYVDVINYSGGGTEFSSEEREVVMEALSKGIKVVAAAGNERSNIDKYSFYPAMYDKRIYVVGNLAKPPIVKKIIKEIIKVVKGKKRVIAIEESQVELDITPSSNYGTSVPYWEVGTNVLSRLPNQKYGFMTGTSQATAIKTGKIVREMLDNK